MEAIRFRGALVRILKKVVTADPRLGPVYLSKVHLADAYMSFWVRMEEFSSVAFLILKKTPSNTQLVVFHIFLLMWYIDSAPYFFYGNGDSGRPRKRGHFPEGSGRRTLIGDGSQVQSGRQRWRP